MQASLRFSTYADLRLGVDDDWFDPVLSEDTPLYVDPFLVFDDSDPLFADTHNLVVQFFETCRHLIAQDSGQRGRYWDKAQRLLTFPEPKEFALGLAMGSPIGAGTADFFSRQMAEALEVVSNAGEQDLDYVEVLAVFVPGLGVDRISDIFCNILKNRFITYTQQISQRHNILVETIPVRHATWDARSGRWIDRRVSLPRSPVTGSAVLLTPDRFLQDIPQRITADRFYSWAEGNIAAELRADLNFDLAQALTQAQRRDRGRRTAFRFPGEALRYVRSVADDTVAVPYDVTNDPRGLVGWYELGRCAAQADDIEPISEPEQDDFFEWLGTLIQRFKHAVENTDLWRALWNDDLTRPRIEKIVQAIAGAMWTDICRSAGVDITREANAGRGPVDFKFSEGWSRRALVEVKLLSSSKLRQGAAAQLPQYMLSEQITCAYYACVGFTEQDFAPERLQLVEDTCAAYRAQSGYNVQPRFIDARPKESASNLPV
jgi:hypothetical protein